MRKFLFTNLLFLLFIPTIFAEKSLDLSKEKDRKVASIMKQVIPDEFKNFGAVVMHQKYNYTLKDSAMKRDDKRKTTYTEKWHTIVYIQKESGTDMGNLNVGYDAITDKMDVETARRIDSSSKYKEVDKSDIHDVAIDNDPRVTNYEKKRLIELSLKDVKKDDFVEYETEKSSTEKMGNSGFGRIFSFDTGPFPALYLEKCFEMSENVPFYYKLVDNINSIKVTTKTVGHNKEYCFLRENSYPETKEKDTPKRVYKTPLLYVTTWKSWDEFSVFLAEKYRDVFTPDENIIRLVNSITSGLTKEESIREIYHWIEKNIRYVQTYLILNSGFIPAKAEEVLSRRFGDCKEKTTLFISMLKVLNIQAYPVFIATSSTIDADLDFPTLYNFNHVITYIEDNKIFLDPTSETTSYPYLPSGDKGRNVLILKGDKLVKDNTKWSEPSGFHTDAVHNVSIDGLKVGEGQPKMIYESSYTYKGNEAEDLRAMRDYSLEKIEDYIRKYYIKDNLISFNFESDLSNFNEGINLIATHESNLKTLSYTTNDLKVSMSSIFQLPIPIAIYCEDDFFNYDNREYPYVWSSYALQSREKWSIKIPEEYDIYNLPKDSIIDNDIMYFSVKYNRLYDLVEIEKILQIKKPILEVSEFNSIRKILEENKTIFNNNILLVRSLDHL